MVNRTGIVYSYELDKGFSSRFCVGSWVWHGEGWRTYQPKCVYNNEDELNSPNILSDKNYQASSHKFRQITKSLMHMNDR